MVTEIARYTIKGATGDKFAERLSAAIVELTSDPETVDVSMYRGIENPDDFQLIVTWTSTEAHMAWRNKEARTRFRAAIDELLDAPIQVAHFDAKQFKGM